MHRVIIQIRMILEQVLIIMMRRRTGDQRQVKELCDVTCICRCALRVQLSITR
jgi:hypothetical protein